MYEFWYDWIKPKYGERAKICFIGTYSFAINVKTDDIYKDIVEDVETRFDTSNYELDRPLPKRKYKKVFGPKKDKWSRKIMKEFFGIRAKTYS